MRRPAWVTDTYAHGFDADRQLIAHEMDTGSFAKVGAASTVEEVDTDMLSKLKALIQNRPELVSELLKGTGKRRGSRDREHLNVGKCRQNPAFPA